MEKNRGGRPREGDALKSAPIGIRTDPALRTRLEEAAARNKNTLTKEVERRLRESLVLDEIGPTAGVFARMTLHLIDGVQQLTAQDFDKGQKAFLAVKAGLEMLLSDLQRNAPLDHEVLLEQLEAIASTSQETLAQIREIEKEHPNIRDKPENVSPDVIERYSSLVIQSDHLIAQYDEMRPKVAAAQAAHRNELSDAAKLARQVINGIVEDALAYMEVGHGS